MTDARINPWWKANKTDLPAELAKRMKVLERLTYEQRADNLLFINIAANFNPNGAGAYGSLYTLTSKNKIRRNLASAGVRLLSSLVTASRTLPVYSTTGADWETRRKAEQKARVIHAQMIQLGAFALGDQAVTDASHVGDGFTMGILDPETGKPKLVRALPNSVFTDAAEGRDPRSLYWEHFLPRETLMEHHGKEKLAESAGPSPEDYDTFLLRKDDKTADLVKVVEAWHLPIGTKPGRHVVATNNCLLIDEEWNLPRFPCAVMRYEDRIVGWHGQGLVERLLPAQLRIAELQRFVDRSQNAGSRPTWLVEENSNLTADDISNLEGQVLTYLGTAPQQVTWSGTPQDLVEEINRTWINALEQEGLNPSMAAGNLPQKSLNSGRAVRAADDVATRPALGCIRKLEQYYLQVAQLLCDLNDLVAAADKNHEVFGYNFNGARAFLATSKWADLALDEADARLSVLPMSALPSTLQARLATVSELIAEGYVSRAQATALQEMPDYQAWQDSETAQIDLVQWQIDRMLEGQDELPIPRQDYRLCVDEATKAYLVQYRSGAPQEVLDRLDAYITYAEDQLE